MLYMYLANKMSMRLACNYCSSSVNIVAHECVLKDV